MRIYPHVSSFLQVLLTGNDLQHESSQSSLLNTMNSLLGMKMVPVLNGNDVVAPDPTISSDLENVRKASVYVQHYTIQDLGAVGDC